MILGISGVAGSGKDTFADILVNQYNFQKLAFADPIKEFCKKVYAFSNEQLWGPSKFRNRPDSRYVRLNKDVCESFVELTVLWHDLSRSNEGDTPLHTFLGLTREEYADWVETGEVHLTPRYALQKLGTEWGRSCWPNTWVSMVIREAEELDGASMVIPDVRFRNEIDAIYAAGGKVIRRKGRSSTVGDHISESAQLAIPDSYFTVVLDEYPPLAKLPVIVAETLQKLGYVTNS